MSNAMARYVAKTAVILALLSATIARPADRVPATTQPAPSRIDMPSFGISVPIPKGFKRFVDDQTSVVYFIPTDAPADKHPDRMLWVDVFPSNDIPLATIADDLARKGRLTRGRPEVKWGDRDAIEHSILDGTATLRQLVAVKDGYVYRLQSATYATYGGIDVYDAFISGTRWLATEHPGKGVALRHPSLRLANGMVVSFPDPFRPDAKPGTKNVTSFYAADLLQKTRTARIMSIAMPPAAGPYTLAGVMKDAQANLTEVLGLDEPFRWDEPLAAEGDVAFAETPQLRMKNGGVAQVLVACQGDRIATVFAFDTQSEQKDREGMERVVPFLMQSIREGAAIKVTPAPKKP